MTFTYLRNMSTIEIIGWLGAILLLLGFTLNVFRVIHAGTKIYLLLNATSSGMLLYNAWANEAFPFVVVNFTWLVFSSIKLIQAMRTQE